MGPQPAGATPRLPVSIVTGFLGSGKTSLLNRLIAAPAMARSLVVINEFGAIGLDHLLIEAPDENLLLLDNGPRNATATAHFREKRWRDWERTA